MLRVEVAGQLEIRKTSARPRDSLASVSKVY